ncbi:hypothetical protein KR018_003371 [Drosophila ironensis]|nr:hypothetical protein KR018_003371 [Drosophila ironensis]
MGDVNSLNVTVDVVWPTIIVLAMLVVNGFVFAYIMKKRKQYKNLAALSEPPRTTTSYNATGEFSVLPVPPQTTTTTTRGEEDEECAIEMERL